MWRDLPIDGIADSNDDFCWRHLHFDAVYPAPYVDLTNFRILHPRTDSPRQLRLAACQGHGFEQHLFRHVRQYKHGNF